MNNNVKLEENNLSLAERQKLVEDNLKLVWYYVHRICNIPDQKEDCFQEGCKGLLRAAKYYDESRERTFSAFAAFEIQCSIRDYLFSNRLIRVPDVQRTQLTAYYRKINTLSNDQVELTSDILWETAKEFGLTDEVASIVINGTVSLQSSVSSSESDSDKFHVEDLIAVDENIEDDCVDEMSFHKLFEVMHDIRMIMPADRAEFEDLLLKFWPHFIRSAIGPYAFESVMDIISNEYIYDEYFKWYNDEKERIMKEERENLDNLLKNDKIELKAYKQRVRSLDRLAVTKIKDLSMKQLLAKEHPEYDIKENDTKEQVKAKEKGLDGIYCRLSSCWTAMRKDIQEYVDLYFHSNGKLRVYTDRADACLARAAKKVKSVDSERRVNNEPIAVQA